MTALLYSMLVRPQLELKSQFSAFQLRSFEQFGALHFKKDVEKIGKNTEVRHKYDYEEDSLFSVAIGGRATSSCLKL